MSTTLERDSVVTPEIVRDTEEIGAFDSGDGLPTSVVVISLGGGRYAANSFTLKTEQGEVEVKGLACFLTTEEARIYMGAEESGKGVSGDPVLKDLDDVIEIVDSKSNLQALFLLEGASLHDILYIKRQN